MEAPQLTLTIREDTEQIGGVPLEALSGIIDHLRKLVDEIGEAVGEHYGVRSGVQLVLTGVRQGSAILQLAAIPRQTHVINISGQVVGAVGEGLAILQRGPERPPFFSDRALNEARQLVIPRKQSIREITIAATSHTEDSGETTRRGGVPLDAQLQQHVRALLKPRNRHFGSVEGRIYRLEKKRRRLECVLYDRVRRQAITCRFPDELLGQVRDAFNTRVLVSGRLYTDEQGRIQRVEMQEIRRLRSKEEQPSLESLLGTDPEFTGGVDAVTYIRAMRDEQPANR
jgi:hypothetical protein